MTEQIANLKAGDVLEAKLEQVTRMDLIKYSGASGDFNPIHTIDEEAKNAGLPGIIAHGMWTMGKLTKLFTPFYEEGFLQDYKIRFAGMVFLGDVLTLQAVVEEQMEDHVDFNVRVLNQKEKEVIKGSARFIKTN